VEHNAGVDVVRVKARWSDEEVALLVQVLRLTLAGPTRNMNQFLHAKFPQRTLEGIKGRRKNPDTKLQVTCGVDSTQLRSSLVEERVLSGGNVESIGVGDELGFVLREAIRSLDGERRWGAATLKRAIEAFLEGDTDENHLLAWLQLVCPSRTIPGVSRANPPNSRERRRRYYARTQKVWKKNRSAAVKEILNPIEESASAPSVEEMTTTWAEILGVSGDRVENTIERATTELAELWAPITKEEVVASELRAKTSPGLDTSLSRHGEESHRIFVKSSITW
jgi:hypothetical protein